MILKLIQEMNLTAINNLIFKKQKGPNLKNDVLNKIKKHQ